MKNQIGKVIRLVYLMFITIYLLVPISFFSILEGETNLFQSTNEPVIFITYFSIITFQIILLLLFVNLEYRIAVNSKNQLKDNYSHDLGNLIQVIFGGITLLDMDANLKDDHKKKLDMLSENCIKASDLIKEIRNL